LSVPHGCNYFHDKISSPHPAKRWEVERLTGYNQHIKYIHAIIDPLTVNPTVITGSGNFSESSVLHNDENMTMIKNNLRVSDIYFTEFTRMYHHFEARNEISNLLENYHHRSNPWYLDYYKKGNKKNLELNMFKSIEIAKN
jgi:phosphatidylserine/phosphatidylglycerophosphate/cardiolipin synthase-like enzyme